jgi:nucleoside-diphosphate-sugar epimerase
MNILELGVKHKLDRIIIPSSMAVWGKHVQQDNTPQDSVLQPTTMYGVTKVAGEVLCDYYVQKFGLDCRGLRYPGIISSETLPGGGTTDYAVEIFYEAVKNKRYTCFLKDDAMLPDCLKATIDLACADFSKLVHHSNFNVASMSFTPRELAVAIQEFMPDFQIDYKPDFRQAIAESWTHTIDDSCARKEWNWAPSFEMRSMVKDMLDRLTEKHKQGLI